ncbi:Fc.00g092720.m01.CDS01 [Cosmosporella sp. VM-42]
MAFVASDNESEFGYDFSAEEEQLLLQLAANKSGSSHMQSTVNNPDHVRLAIDSVPEKAHSVFSDDVSDFGSTKASGSGSTETTRLAITAHSVLPSLAPAALFDQDVSYPDLSRALSNIEAESPQPPVTRSEIPEDDPFEDGRSPLQRFRSYPRKPLTVSDLTSGAWCELQYWYTLTRLPGGRRTRTAAMRQGSKVHQKLEDEVHTTVKIDILTKEDGFGLKLWNLVQGLRTLRDTGLTRELEVWGMVDDNLVNGIIDGVSYDNPNPEFEEELSSQESQGDYRQSSLTDYFPPKKSETKMHPGPKIYLTDVKTRGSLAPVSNALLRPAKIQLLLYHRFLSDMAAGKLNFLKVLRRYGLDPDDPFSDTFIAQVGSLHDEIFVDASSSSELDTNDFESGSRHPSAFDTTSSSPGPDLLKYRTLRELLPLVCHELELTFPHGEHSLGHMLRVQYVYRADGRELDQHDFPVSRQALEAYLAKYMGWWRGERKANGVEIEEAFKCRTCEFVSDCSWRQGMDEDRVRKAQQKVWAARRASGN